MKRIFALIVLIALSLGCMGETTETYDANASLALFEILVTCDTFYNFDEIPDPEFAREAVSRYIERMATISEMPDETEIYCMLFASGQYEYVDAYDTYFDALPVSVQIESAIESGTGAWIVSLKVEKDYGYGMEHAYYCDIHVLPDASAPFSARVTRVFIPE